MGEFSARPRKNPSKNQPQSFSGIIAVAAVLALGAAALLARAAFDRPRVALANAHTAAARPAELMNLGKLPEFSLIDQDGKPFTRAQLEGHVWVADLIFTRCAGQCPMMNTHMSQLGRALGAQGLRLASFSVDPEHDTPEVLAEYAKRWDAGGAPWSFVTGGAGEVSRLAREGFKLSAGDGAEAEPGAAPDEANATDALATHSTRLVLIDRAAHVRGVYSAEDPEAVKRLASDAQQLLASDSVGAATQAATP